MPTTLVWRRRASGLLAMVGVLTTVSSAIAQGNVNNPFAHRGSGGVPHAMSSGSPSPPPPVVQQSSNNNSSSNNSAVPYCPPTTGGTGYPSGSDYNAGFVPYYPYGYGPYGYNYPYNSSGYGYPYGYGYNNYGYDNSYAYPYSYPRQVSYPSTAVYADPTAEEQNALAATAVNDRRNDLAERYIEFGDKQFGQGRYGEAQLRYRKAIDAAPAQALGYYRRAQALIAVGKYQAAAEALQQGLLLNPDFVKSKFKLAALYQDRGGDLVKHLEILQRAADASPDNADLALLLAWQLHFTGERDAAHQQAARGLANGGNADAFQPLFSATAPEVAVRDAPAENPPRQKPAAKPATRQPTPRPAPAANTNADPGLDI